MRTKDARTVVYLDMAHYSAVLQSLEKGHRLGTDVARMLDAQIRGLVRQAADDTGAAFDDVFVKGTGDGAILDFPAPEAADRFAEALHRLADERHNRTAREETQHRSFRVGIFSGELARTDDGDAAGLVLSDAARLEQACKTGQVLVDAGTWQRLPEDRQESYGPVETVRGKGHDPWPFEVRRRQVVPPAPWEREDTGRGGQLSANEERFVTDVFDALRGKTIVMLLAQEDCIDRAVLERILERAEVQRRLSLRVTLPASSEPETGRYFASIARQCDFKDVRSSIDWEDALDRRLRDGESLFLLVDGFESASEDGWQELCKILHALREAHGSKFWVALSGEEHLAALKYQRSESMLKGAKRLDWPEADAEDVLAWRRREYPEGSLSLAGAEDILELCGGHPRLVRVFLDRLGRGEPKREALVEAVWPLFSCYQNDDQSRRRLCGYLEEVELGEAHPWIGDALKRRLYWTNALAARDGKLVWRCGAVRDVGRQVLGCK